MRPFRLARIAAEAEGVRLRGMATRIVTRIVLAVIALFFVLGAVVFGHIAAWYEVRTALDQSYLATTGILGGVDLLLAVILGFLAFDAVMQLTLDSLQTLCKGPLSSE